MYVCVALSSVSQGSRFCSCIRPLETLKAGFRETLKPALLRLRSRGRLMLHLGRGAPRLARAFVNHALAGVLQPVAGFLGGVLGGAAGGFHVLLDAGVRGSGGSIR